MRSLPMFSIANYDEWKIRMQVHLAAMNDEMWDVIQYGPIIMDRSPGFGSYTANFTPYSDLLSLRLQTLSP